MKKLFFLLLILLAGFGVVFAATNPAQPPGVYAEAVMAEYGINDGIVTQPTVLVSALPTEKSSFLAVVEHDNLTALSGDFISISLDTGQHFLALENTCRDADYHLRL